MIEYSGWAQELHSKVKNNPKYLATQLMIEISEQFYLRMEEKGFTQRELAKRIGKSQPYVAKVLGHGTNMTLETIALFADALELDVQAPRFMPKGIKNKAQFDNVPCSTIIHCDFNNKTFMGKRKFASNFSASKSIKVDQLVRTREEDTDDIANAS